MAPAKPIQGLDAPVRLRERLVASAVARIPRKKAKKAAEARERRAENRINSHSTDKKDRAGPAEWVLALYSLFL